VDCSPAPSFGLGSLRDTIVQGVWKRRRPCGTLGAVSDKGCGTAKDVSQHEQVAAPTLVGRAEDDGLQPDGRGQNTAARVPGARLAACEQGGHPPALQLGDAREAMTAFVARHTAGAASNTRGAGKAVR
jgi:pimeloyl-ACP methyl ester carboxylesterase